MKREGVFLKNHIPDTRSDPDEVEHKNKNDFYYGFHYETYTSLALTQD